MTHLFQHGDFTLHSGKKSTWKIEGDALTPSDWEGLAAIAVTFLPPFTEVYGVPRGGIPLAKAMTHHLSLTGEAILPRLRLICEDVITTGSSIEAYRKQLEVQYGSCPTVGLCVFARGSCPGWILPLFQMPIISFARKRG
jgi:orotate phosphoribosyltransferase